MSVSIFNMLMLYIGTRKQEGFFKMSFFDSKTALVVSAHPDDEVLGVGGTIALMARNNIKVYVVFVASGISARYETPESHKEQIQQEVQILKQDAKRAAQVLGVSDLFYLDLPDNRLDTISRMDIAHKLKKIVNSVLPDIVFTHHHGDYNWDHTITFGATLMAVRPNAGDFYPTQIYSYEVLSSTERQVQNPQFVFAPTTFVDIKPTIDIKKRALECYSTELGEYPHPRSLGAVENLACMRGNAVGMEYAEAFTLVRNLLAV